MRQVLMVLLGLGVLFGPEVLRAAAGGAAAAHALDVDRGRSLGGRVHIAYCTS